jgi:prevent-host-death family protein
MSAKEAKNNFGHLIDSSRAEPVTIEKHGRPVVVVLAIETFEQLSRGQPSNLPRIVNESEELQE